MSWFYCTSKPDKRKAPLPEEGRSLFGSELSASEGRHDLRCSRVVTRDFEGVLVLRVGHLVARGLRGEHDQLGVDSRLTTVALQSLVRLDGTGVGLVVREDHEDLRAKTLLQRVQHRQRDIRATERQTRDSPSDVVQTT